MTYNLGGTWGDVAARFDDALKLAHDRPQAVHQCTAAAMAALVAATSVRVRGGVAADEIRRFVRDSSDALLLLRVPLAVWLSSTLRKAEHPEDDDWYELCVRRSAVQVLLDDYAGTPVAQLVEAVLAEEAGYFLDARVESGLPHLDDEMRRVGLEQGPLPKHLVIPMPASHWWWRYPEPPNGPSPA